MNIKTDFTKKPNSDELEHFNSRPAHSFFERPIDPKKASDPHIRSANGQVKSEPCIPVNNAQDLFATQLAQELKIFEKNHEPRHSYPASIIPALEVTYLDGTRDKAKAIMIGPNFLLTGYDSFSKGMEKIKQIRVIAWKSQEDVAYLETIVSDYEIYEDQEYQGYKLVILQVREAIGLTLGWLSIPPNNQLMTSLEVGKEDLFILIPNDLVRRNSKIMDEFNYLLTENKLSIIAEVFTPKIFYKGFPLMSFFFKLGTYLLKEKNSERCLSAKSSQNNGKKSAENLLTQFFEIACEYDSYSLNQQALGWFHDCLKIKITPSEEMKTYVIKIYQLIGLRLYELKQFDQAKESLEIALELSRIVKNEGWIKVIKNFLQKEFPPGCYHNEDLLIVKTAIIREQLILEDKMKDGLFWENCRDFPKALENFMKCLEIKSELEGDDTQGLLNLHFKIGQTYMNMSEYDKASESLLKAVELHKKLALKANEQLFNAYCYLGKCYKKMHYQNNHLMYLERAYKIGIELFGDKHEKIVSVLYKIGAYYYSEEMYDEALENLGRCMLILKKTRVEKKLAMKIYKKFGLNLELNLSFQPAIKYFQKALELAENLFGQNNLKTADMHRVIGLNYFKQHQIDRALISLEKYLDLHNKLKGKTVHYLLVLNYIGLCYVNKQNYQKALTYFEQSIEFQTKEDFHIEIMANPLFNSACCHFKLQNFDQAIPILLQCTEFSKSVLLKSDLDLYEIYSLLEQSYKAENEFLAAIKMYECGLEIKPLRQNIDDVKSMLSKGLCMLETGDVEKAKFYIGKAWVLRSRLPGDEEPSVDRIRDYLEKKDWLPHKNNSN